MIGYNARMDGFQGAVLSVKLKHLDKWNQERNRVAQRYREKLEDLPITLPSEFKANYQVYHQFVVETDLRDEFQNFLLDNGIPTLLHYPIPVHKQKGFIDAGFASGSYPITEKLSERIPFAGIETFLPIFHGTTSTLRDYLPDNALIIIDDPNTV